MTDQPTPAMVPAGHVVTVRVFRQVYTSPVMAKTDADALRASTVAAIRQIGATYDLFAFTCGDGTSVDIRGRMVSVVEVGRPQPRRDHGPVHVHLHVTDDPPNLDGPTARSAPTPAVFDRRRPR